MASRSSWTAQPRMNAAERAAGDATSRSGNPLVVRDRLESCKPAMDASLRIQTARVVTESVLPRSPSLKSGTCPVESQEPFQTDCNRHDFHGSANEKRQSSAVSRTAPESSTAIATASERFPEESLESTRASSSHWPESDGWRRHKCQVEGWELGQSESKAAIAGRASEESRILWIGIGLSGSSESLVGNARRSKVGREAVMEPRSRQPPAAIRSRDPISEARTRFLIRTTVGISTWAGVSIEPQVKAPLFWPKTSRRAFSARARTRAPPAPRSAIRAGRPAGGPGRSRRPGCRGRSGSLRRFPVFCQRP